jgi:hypothetical protein
MKLIAAQVDFTAEHPSSPKGYAGQAAETAEENLRNNSACFAVSAVRVRIFYAFGTDTDNYEKAG